MSKIESPFHIDEEAEFRFSFILESRSVNAHSLMDSGYKDNLGRTLKENMRKILDSIVKDPRFETIMLLHMANWKEKHKG